MIPLDTRFANACKAPENLYPYRDGLKLDRKDHSMIPSFDNLRHRYTMSRLGETISVRSGITCYLGFAWLCSLFC